MTETAEPYAVETALQGFANAVIQTDQAMLARIADLEAQVRDLKRATDPTLYTAKQVESVLGITAPTRRELTFRGELPVIHIDSRPRYLKRDVEALIARKASVS